MTGSSRARAATGARRASGRGGAASKGDRREQAILDAFQTLLTERPFADISVGAIATRAGVGRTAFYFYFPSREVALAALAERSVAPIYEVGRDWLFGDGDAVPALRAGLLGLVDFWVSQSHLLVALIDAAASDRNMLGLWRAQVEQLAEAAARRIERDAARGLTWPGVRPHELATTLAWMTERYCFMYLGDRPWARPPEEVHASLAHLWEHAIYRPEV